MYVHFLIWSPEMFEGKGKDYNPHLRQKEPKSHTQRGQRRAGPGTQVSDSQKGALVVGVSGALLGRSQLALLLGPPHALQGLALRGHRNKCPAIRGSAFISCLAPAGLEPAPAQQTMRSHTGEGP